ncbi:50S ribosomal protein L3 [Candidatus Gracilibacteria bacterium]|nr:50S ribosomal protein L3 [Candidatus Gracilibacteria bacterium]
MPGILGKKLGMTRVIQDDGRVIPMTIVECVPNVVTQIKTVEKDGYPALVLGFCPLKKPTKTRKFYHVKEFTPEQGKEYKDGDEIKVELFNEGENIAVTSVSKGKGTQGVVRRFHMAGGPKTHGSHFRREPGSIGARAKPGKIHRGKHLPGRMGTETVTKKTRVVMVDAKHNLIGIKGPVAGGNHSLVIIKKLS